MACINTVEKVLQRILLIKWVVSHRFENKFNTNIFLEVENILLM